MPMRAIAAMMLLLFLTTQASYAAAPNQQSKVGLGISYSKIFVQNLPIGQKISLIEIVNLPLEIISHYQTPVLVTVFPEKPREDGLEEGFENIPDENWIVPEFKSVTITANGTTSMDVTLVIPDDPKLFGRKFQGDIVVNTGGDLEMPSMVKYGFNLRGKILFTIAPGRNEEALKSIKENKIDASYSFLPERVDVWEVKPGKKVKVVSRFNKPVILKNESPQKQEYYLASLAPKDTTVPMDKIAQATNVADQVVLKDDVIKLNPRQTRTIPIEINVPKNVDFEKGPLFYLVSVKSGKNQAIEKFVKIYLWDKKRP